MQQAEYNHEDFSNIAEADKSLMVRFFMKSVHNKMASAQQGHPVFKEKVYIEIRVPGQTHPQACRPVTHADKQRFPIHFKAYEDRVEPPTDGMPLMEWPKMTRSQAEEMAFKNIKTVEQLAATKDANLQQFMNGYQMRDAAVKWLESNSQETDDREKAELKEQVATLTAQVAKLIKLNTPVVGRMTVDPQLGIAITDDFQHVPNPEVDTSGLSDEEKEILFAETRPELKKYPESPGTEHETPASQLDEPEVEGKAVKVPAAPGARKPRAKRKK